jgi:hypothetical protein
MRVIMFAVRHDMQPFLHAVQRSQASSAKLIGRKVLYIASKPPNVYTSVHIRPMAVSPLNHPEGVPNPWGFSFSGSAKPRLCATREAYTA